MLQIILKEIEKNNSCKTLISYISTSQKPYSEIVRTTNQFTAEAEASLKEIIEESKSAFLKTKQFLFFSCY